MFDAVFKLGLRRSQGEPVSDLAEDRGFARLNDQHLSRAAANTCAHEDGIGASRQTGVRRDGRRLLLYRECLASEHGLIDEKVICLQNDAIGRDQTPRGQHDDIARHDLFGGYSLRLATTQHIWI